LNVLKTGLSPFYNGFLLHYVQNMTDSALRRIVMPTLGSDRRSTFRIVRTIIRVGASFNKCMSLAVWRAADDIVGL
jgi:hypothetical protein